MIYINDWQSNKEKWLDTDLALMTSNEGWKERSQKKGISIWQRPFPDDKNDLFRWRLPRVAASHRGDKNVFRTNFLFIPLAFPIKPLLSSKISTRFKNEPNLSLMKKFLFSFAITTLLSNITIAQISPPSVPIVSGSAIIEGIKWRELGPFRGGRSCTVTGVKGNPNLYYMGGVGGGVWRTTDAGQTWGNITDNYFGGTIGAVAVAESDPNVVYVGEGEQTLRNNVASGAGVWRSTDAGTTWKSIGLTDTRHISRIRIHPKNSDVVYVAAIGNLWKPNEMRGIFRSTDGGVT